MTTVWVEDLPLWKFSNAPVKITLLPFYGGAKGQTLQVIETADGRVSTQVINLPIRESTSEKLPSEVENPQLPDKFENDYDKQISSIHKTTLKVLELQEKAKRNGKLTEDEEEEYKVSMDVLTASAENLAKIHEGQFVDELESRSTGLSEWFDRKKTSSKKDKDKKKEEEERKKEEQKRKEEEQKRKEEEDRRKEEEEKEDEDGDTVSVNLPPEDAAVAEAKPIGLAIAGIGGVAASKPIATAVVGPGGLAIARPVGTAIAGVSPEQALVPIYPEGYLKPSKGSKKGSKKEAEDEYLNKLLEKYHHV